MSEIFMARQLGKQLVPILDELTDGLMTMFDTKRVPLWLMYATETFLDINYTLRKDVTRALTDLRSVGDRTSISLQRYFA